MDNYILCTKCETNPCECKIHSEHCEGLPCDCGVENIKLTPRYIVEAKYNSILQIVESLNDWEQKYPLLEKVITGLLEDKEKELKKEIEELKEKLFEKSEFIYENDFNVIFNKLK